jgi:hypothetical protein
MKQNPIVDAPRKPTTTKAPQPGKPPIHRSPSVKAARPRSNPRGR